jgi:hypothetical protein
MRHRGWIRALLFLGIAGAACGSDTPPLGDTGLPEAAFLAGMTADEWQTFCKAFDAARRKAPEEDCQRTAFAETRMVAANNGTEADVRATCQTRYDACMREVRPSARTSSICQFGPVGPDCTATVLDAEDCLKAGVAFRQAEEAKIPSCAVVTVQQAMTYAGTVGPIDAQVLALPACLAFNAKCSGLLR